MVWHRPRLKVEQLQALLEKIVQKVKQHDH